LVANPFVVLPALMDDALLSVHPHLIGARAPMVKIRSRLDQQKSENTGVKPAQNPAPRGRPLCHALNG
jgi:hypothetical protein